MKSVPVQPEQYQLDRRWMLNRGIARQQGSLLMVDSLAPMPSVTRDCLLLPLMHDLLEVEPELDLVSQRDHETYQEESQHHAFQES